MKTQSRWLGILAFLALAVLAGCGGGGGGGGGGGVPAGPPASVDGEWTVTETGTNNTCGDPVDPPYTITIAQDANSLTVTTPVGTTPVRTFSGNINGNVITWTGSYLEDGGTTTITSLTATVSGNTFSGSSSWTWTNGIESCAGTTTFTGALTGSSATVTIGGAISGLSGTVVLQNNGGDNLSRSANGAFTFTGAVNSGSDYDVTVSTHPAGQTCTVSNGSGVANANVTNVSVTCSAQTFTLTTATAGLGSVTRNPNATSYAAGAQVQLTAVPQPGNAFSSWSGGLTGSQNPATVTMNGNLSVTANFAAATTTLTVVKAGLGAGTVTGTGINCGADCTQSFSSGSVVLLTPTPAAGSTFGSWTGCDNVTGNTCTVNMTASRTVTATFNQSLTLSAPAVLVPATNTTGSYNVTVSCTGFLCSTTFFLQEAPNTAFANPTQTTFFNSTFPREIPFTGKAAGTYCYRAAFMVPNWGNAACVTVSLPTTAVLRISNTSSYDIIDARLNNMQKVNYPYVIPVGQSFDFVFTTAGTVNFALGNGFYNSDQSRNVWFTLTGTTSVTPGQTTTVTFANPTIGQLLTGFSTAQNWDGMYFENLNPFFKRFRFTSSGGWQLFDSTASCLGGPTCSFTPTGSGTVRLVSWPAYSPIVTFDFGPNTNPANIGFPFGSFLYRNGPASWPLIEYVRQ